MPLTHHPQLFDDDVSSFALPGVATSVGAAAASLSPTPNPGRMFACFADGTYAGEGVELGNDIFPTLFPHHMLHEAGTRYLERWTSVNTDAKIRAFRREFLFFLRDTFLWYRTHQPSGF
jgi:hypothetical protein